MTDSLRSTLEAAVASAEKQEAAAPAPAPAPAPAVEAPAPAPAPADPPPSDPYKGDSDKSSVPKPEDSPKTEQNVADPNKEKPDEQKQEPTEQSSQDSRAPQSWKPVAKAAWDKLPAEVKADVVRREREITRVLNETANERKLAQNIRETVKPFEQRIRAAGVHPVQAIQSMLYVDHKLATGTVAERAAFCAQMIKDYQIDISALDAALSGEDPATAPEAAIERLLNQKLAPVTEFMSRQKQTMEQAEQRMLQETQTTIENMANNPKFPDFELVREDMADIIEISTRRGVPLTLEQAYTKAVAMNDDAKAAAQTRAQQASAQNANSAAQRALAASASVTGSPSSLKSTPPATDLRGTIMAAMAEQGGR